VFIYWVKIKSFFYQKFYYLKSIISDNTLNYYFNKLKWLLSYKNTKIKILSELISNKNINLNCPICNTESIFIFISKHQRDIFQCTNDVCGHFFTPQLTDNQGIVFRDDAMSANSDKDLRIYGERNKRLLKLFLKYLNKKNFPLTFLDYGAGTAHISRTFKQVLANKVNIYCLELNPACKDLYKKYGLFQISTLKEIEKKIDFIYMIEVIEHLENPIESMKQLRKILNLNALIFLSTPLGTIKENQTHAYETSSHLHFFSRKSFNLMLKKSGFAEIKFKYYSEMYPIPSNNYQRLKMAVKGFINNSFLEYFSKNKHITGYTKLTNI